jgi:hypothetical protein
MKIREILECLKLMRDTREVKNGERLLGILLTSIEERVFKEG